MDDPWWPLTWIPADAEYTPTSIDWPTAEVTHKGKTVWVDDFPANPCYYVGLRRTYKEDKGTVTLPHDMLVLRCFLKQYFEHADEGEWPSDFWKRMQEE